MADSYRNTIESLHRVATKLQSQETVQEVCNRTVSAAAEVLEFNLCTVTIQEDEWLVPYATSEDSPTDGTHRMRLDQGLAGKTYQSGQSQVVKRIRSGDDTDPAKECYRSGMSVPIGGHGVFQAVSTTEAAFDEDDVKLAELLVSHTNTALDRIEREQELKREVDRLEQFASVVSHDLRNPLSIAQGYLELARKERESQSLKKTAEAHERMDHLINDLLTFARMGTEAIDMETIELAHLTEGCWTSLEQRDATLRVEIDQKVRGDRDRLRQLVENLLCNAVKYGGKNVSIAVGALGDGFYIADDGPGISADERTAVFEAGHSLGTDGTGFGLSIAKQVTDAHGWDIRATESAEGGARFEITGVDFAVE